MNADQKERMRNKIFALEKQNKAFTDRIHGFRNATLWQRLVMAWKGEV